MALEADEHPASEGESDDKDDEGKQAGLEHLRPLFVLRKELEIH